MIFLLLGSFEFVVASQFEWRPWNPTLADDSNTDNLPEPVDQNILVAEMIAMNKEGVSNENEYLILATEVVPDKTCKFEFYEKIQEWKTGLEKGDPVPSVNYDEILALRRTAEELEALVEFEDYVLIHEKLKARLELENCKLQERRKLMRWKKLACK